MPKPSDVNTHRIKVIWWPYNLKEDFYISIVIVMEDIVTQQLCLHFFLSFPGSKENIGSLYML